MFERRYSLAKFSVNLETKTIEIAETFSEALNSVAGVAIPVDVRERVRRRRPGLHPRDDLGRLHHERDRGPLLRGENVGEHCRRFTAAERLAAEVEAIKNLRAALGVR